MNTELKAPKGKFRVVGVDTFESPTADYLIGDYKEKETAIVTARIKGGEMNRTYVYDDNGKEVSGGFGSY